jgi:hypothetical protein
VKCMCCTVLKTLAVSWCGIRTIGIGRSNFVFHIFLRQYMHPESPIHLNYMSDRERVSNNLSLSFRKICIEPIAWGYYHRWHCTRVVLIALVNNCYGVGAD